MIDLGRLKIDAVVNPAKKKSFGGAIRALAFFILGFLTAMLIGGGSQSSVRKVRTVMVGGEGLAVEKSFTAGGWIEARTPVYPIVVSGRISEKLERVLVHEGETVAPGQVVAQFYDRDIRAQLDLARARHDAAQKNYEKIRAGWRKEDIDAAEARALRQAEQLRIAHANYERGRKTGSSVLSTEQLDILLATYRQAEAEHAMSQAELSKMKAGNREEEVAIALSELRQAESALEIAARNLDYCTVVAPDVGKPLRVLRVYIRVGEWVDEKTSERRLISFYDPEDMQARVDVSQSNIRYVRVGGRAEVLTDANPEKKYAGEVLRVEPLAELSKNTVTVRVRIADPDEMLFPDMVAQVTFAGGASSSGADGDGDGGGGIRLPSEAVLSEHGEHFVFVVSNGRLNKRKISVGESSGGNLTVTAGLFSGQRVAVGELGGLSDGQRIEE